ADARAAVARLRRVAAVRALHAGRELSAEAGQARALRVRVVRDLVVRLLVGGAVITLVAVRARLRAGLAVDVRVSEHRDSGGAEAAVELGVRAPPDLDVDRHVGADRDLRPGGV